MENMNKNLPPWQEVSFKRINEDLIGVIDYYSFYNSVLTYSEYTDFWGITVFPYMMNHSILP